MNGTTCSCFPAPLLWSNIKFALCFRKLWLDTMIQTPGACPSLLAISVPTEGELAEQVSCPCWSAPFSTQSSIIIDRGWARLAEPCTASALPLPWREGCSAGKVRAGSWSQGQLQQGTLSPPCAQGSDEVGLPRSNPAQISQRELLALWLQQLFLLAQQCAGSPA